jgi:hypothetical protein
MSTYIFKHNWLQKEVLTANGTQNALIVYMCVKYGMDIILKSKIDFEVLKYYITNTIKDGEHISNAVLYNIITALAETPEIVDKLFTIAPICQFTLSQIENILYVLIPHTVYFMQVFSQEYVEPLHWCSNSTLELQLDAECAIRGLTLDDRAIIGMYMEDELSRHRARIQKVMSSMAKSVLHRRKTLGKWYISRISDQHSASANVLRYLKERSDGEKEQAEIDREQSRILLNWSQEHFDVAEWKHDGADEHDVQLKMNSGDTYDTELHDSADNSTETDNE